jgi:hypothetical protein
MKNFKIAITLFWFLLLAFSACKKDRKDTLPAETQEGYLTFGCLVNNRVWLPEASTSAVKTIVIVRDSAITIAANQGVAEGLTIVLKNTKILSDTLYIINSDNNSFAIYFNTCDINNYCNYRTSLKFQGQLFLTRFDTIEKIVSGRFSFKAGSEEDPLSDCICDTSVIDITEGRFDLLF